MATATDTTIALIEALYRTTYGFEPSAVCRLAGAGSSRLYYRVEGPKTVVACKAANRRENDDFILLDGLLRKHGVRVPAILAYNPEEMVSLQQDLGNTDLFSQLGSENARELTHKALHELVKAQTLPRKLWDGKTSQQPFSAMRVMWDLNYFKYEFVKAVGIEIDEFALQADFDLLASQIDKTSRETWGFMYRDFQSRNVMVHDGKTWLIDFQGGMYGPCLYDAVSFLWQAKAGFSEEFRKEMLAYYAGEFRQATGVHEDVLLAPLSTLVLLRTLQVLGAYGLRGIVERKAHFIESIPQAVDNLMTLVEKGVLVPYPELERICREIGADKRFRKDSGTRLVVEISSFSYKKGYPVNFTGNGGGFMFDCRALPNPGRYERYRRSTGKDEDVRQFFSLTTEMDRFIANTMAPLEKAVKVYAARGFTHLQVGYGCTGGQHRSVYCAETAARHVAACIRLGKYPHKAAEPPVVHLIHREQGIDQWL